MPSNIDVLIVEDEIGLAELFDIWLSEHYSVETFTSGRSALDALDDHLDAVVLDWRMPDITGADILERIRADGLECRVVVVTGLDPDTAGIEGVDATLRKPVNREELVGVVGEVTSKLEIKDE